MLRFPLSNTPMSTYLNTIPRSSPPLFPRATTNPPSFSLLRLFLLSKPFKRSLLRIRDPTPLAPSLRPLLPPPRVTFDIPIKIDDEAYQRYLDSEPWKGAIVYKRDASASHVEFCTSLNRLAIGWLASRLSADRSAQMGLKLPDDLNWESDDEDEDGEEDEDEDGDEDGEDDGNDRFSEELNGRDVALEGVDKDGNPVSLSAEELRNAKVSFKYGDHEFDFDEFEDDEDEDENEDEDDEEDMEFMDTSVVVSVDVTRRRGRIRLDGIIRTVITLDCNRCFASTPQPVYSNFSLLLSEEPIGEAPDDDNDSIEEIFDEPKTKKTMVEMEGTVRDEDQDIEWDDRLHFPAGEREIDISKHVRDIIHLEVNMNVVCSTNCKGVCLECGSNLNLVKCSCMKVKKGEQSRGINERYGPLRDLKKKLGQ